MIYVTPLEEVLERLHTEMVSTLEAATFSVPGDVRQNFRDAVIAICRIRHRSIPPAPRAVLWSRELQMRTLESSIADALRTIEEESRVGQELNRRLTRSYKSAEFNDHFLNDLGIQHLHLGPPESAHNGQVTGTKELLFVVVRPEHLYFLDVRDHDAFTKSDFLQILSSNWPTILDSCRRSGLYCGSELPPTPEERAHARKRGVSIYTNMDDHVLGPPGGGVTTAGTSTRAVDDAAEFLRLVHDYYNWVVMNGDCIADQVCELTGAKISALDLRIRCEDDEVVFEDTALNALIYPKQQTLRILVAAIAP